MLTTQLCLLAVLLSGVFMPTAVYANHASGNRPSQCYYCTIAVTIVNLIIASSNPSTAVLNQFVFALNSSQIVAGTPFIIQFRVIYPYGTSASGSPVTLSPRVATFSFTNNTGASYVFTSVQVSPVPNQPGNYTYASTLPEDSLAGVITAAVVALSLTDANGAIGPSATIASHNSQPHLAQTASLFDNSVFAIGTAQATPPPPAITLNITTQSVLSMMLVFILGALILMVKGRRMSRAGRIRTD